MSNKPSDRQQAVRGGNPAAETESKQAPFTRRETWRAILGTYWAMLPAFLAILSAMWLIYLLILIWQ
ncbi:MAG: hypothetical protein FWE06_09550 [Oscillospiraceae bacterium]|nr:hypothetical protein [Oscillospiraceae bacterium]